MNSLSELRFGTSHPDAFAPFARRQKFYTLCVPNTYTRT